MVLETLDLMKAEKHPRKMLFLAFIYSTTGLFISLAVFGEYASITGVFITTMPLIVIMYDAFRVEEERDIRTKERKFLIKEHTLVLELFLFMFLGLIISYSFWFTLLPHDTARRAFESQMETIGSIREIGMSGNFLNSGLTSIVSNNLRVLFLCIAFSFLYGGGAIFILVWNASVMGAAIGNSIRGTIVSASPASALYTYFTGFPLGMGYLTHGIFEVLAYFMGALAGGIISFAVVNHHYGSREFRRVLFDSVDLILASIVILMLAGLIEVYVTPILF